MITFSISYLAESRRLCIVRCYFFDPSAVSIGAVVGRQWVAVETACSRLAVSLLCCVV